MPDRFALKIRRWKRVDFAEIAGVSCPCGTARRAFADVAEFPGTVHVTVISEDTRRHYHRTLTETYFILDCEDDAQMELDGEIIPIRERQCIVIPARSSSPRTWTNDLADYCPAEV